MRFVPIESVREGTYLAKTIYDDNGRILLREGVKLTDNLIGKIKKINIFSIYVNDEYSEQIIEDIIKPELRQKAIKSIKNTFNSMIAYNNDSQYKKLSSSQKNIMLKEKQKYFQNIANICEEILEEVLSKKNVLINLVDIKSMDSYTYQHCVNVAIISLVLGIQLNLSKSELNCLCLGALLHDIGKMLIPKEIILKKGTLTSEEFEIVKKHTTKGYEYLLTSLEIPAPARIISLQHHERENGEGYPSGLKGSEINKLSKIVSIADVYDALTSDRPYRKALVPNDALEFIMANAQTYFDFDMTTQFTKSVLPYPPGTIVMMSSGDLALVENCVENYPMRPNIKILKSVKYNVGQAIELVSELNLVIKKVIYEVK